ncbi:MAG: sulfatase-like hydrolase/transferase [Geminicoccaceae bacterium]
MALPSRSVRRLASLALACLLAATGLLPPHAAFAAPRQPPNVLLILADDVGGFTVDDLKRAGLALPNLDALAAAGVQLTRGYATAAYCSPSRAGLMTGRYQQRFAFYGNPPALTDPRVATFGLPRSVPTLAEALHAQGYRTAHIGKWHLGGQPGYPAPAGSDPLSRGYDRFFGFYGGQHSYYREEPTNPIYDDRVAVHEREYLSSAFARETIEFIRASAGRPWFVNLWVNAAHGPYEPEPATLAALGNIRPELRLYAGVVKDLDNALGRILAAVRASPGGLANTLIVFAGDNGCPESNSSCGNRPLRGQKGQVYEGGLRVPFWMAWQGVLPRGAIYRQPVALLDLFPSVLAAATGTSPTDAALDGVDLLPYLTGARSGAPHPVLFWSSNRIADGAVRAGAWKLLEMTPKGAPTRWELYDLDRDEGETTDLAAQQPAKVAELRAKLTAWRRNLPPRLW